MISCTRSIKKTAICRSAASSIRYLPVSKLWQLIHMVSLEWGRIVLSSLHRRRQIDVHAMETLLDLTKQICLFPQVTLPFVSFHLHFVDVSQQSFVFLHMYLDSRILLFPVLLRPKATQMFSMTEILDNTLAFTDGTLIDPTNHFCRCVMATMSAPLFQAVNCLLNIQLEVFKLAQ